VESARNRLPRRPGQTVSCGWCGQAVAVQGRGRPPKWCSQTCRHRAWEQARAAASGRSAVEIVTQTVEVERPVVVSERVTVGTKPTGAAWPAVVAELARQIDSGRIYDRDLPALAESLDMVLAALDRRPAWKRLVSRR
jgi:hypothetical protein